MPRLKLLAILTLALVMVGGVVARAGLTRRWVSGLGLAETRRVELRIWDWWSASTNEEYGDYFDALEAEFEARNPDVDVIFQVVPFGNYVQKLSTAMVGDSPPDVFQSSVYWAEGFYHRGMLRPLDDLLDADPAVQGTPAYVGESAFLPSAWRHNHTEAGETGSPVVFGIPQIIDASCLLWNLDILQEAAADDDERHIAGAAVQTIRTVAFAFGAALAGLIATIAGLGQVPEPAILARAMNWVYGINVIFAVLALGVTVPLCIQARRVIARSHEAAE